MNRSRFILLAVIAVVLLGLSSASAQTAASITPVAGNGQLVCETCPQALFRFFDPMFAKVTDASGNPIANTQVNWNIISGNGILGASQTTTDQTGVAQNTYIQASQVGTLLQEFLQSTIVATAGNASATFTFTQGLSDPQTGLQFVQVYLLSPAAGSTLSGNAGSPAGSQVQVVVKDLIGDPIAGVSLRLVNNQDPTQGASVSCATGAGADTGSVLTDATGTATCTPVFGPISGSGTFFLLVGGVAASVNNNNQPLGYFQSSNFSITVQPGVPGTMKIISGNSQTANPGQSLAGALVAQVGDTGGNPLSGQAVRWTVSPAGAATLSNTSAASDAAGQVRTNVSLAANAAGTVLITVAVSSNPNVSATFSLKVNVQLTGLQKLSGDNQSATINTAFANPLIVQVSTSTGAAVANIAVQFTVSGPATLSATNVNTDASGRAQVTAQALSTPGSVTVTAAAGSFSQTFTLTVTPPAPSITVNSFYNGADFKRGAISPCSIGTIIAPGVAPNIQGVVPGGGLFGPLAYLVANVSVAFNNSFAPIYSVSNVNGQQQVTFQVPCDVTPGNSVPVTVTVNGNGATVNIAVLPVSPGLFQTTMSDGKLRAVLLRPDGSFVSLTNPARRGEQIVAFATGLGSTSQFVGTNSVPSPSSTASVQGQVIVGVNNSGVQVVSSQLTPDLIGVYEVAFIVPNDAPQGQNVVLSMAVNPVGGAATQFSNGTSIPIQ